MSRKKQYPPLLDPPKCSKCKRAVVKETFIRYRPGETPVRLTVYRCLGFRNCPLKVLKSEPVKPTEFKYFKP